MRYTYTQEIKGKTWNSTNPFICLGTSIKCVAKSSTVRGEGRTSMSTLPSVQSLLMFLTIVLNTFHPETSELLYNESRYWNTRSFKFRHTTTQCPTTSLTPGGGGSSVGKTTYKRTVVLSWNRKAAKHICRSKRGKNFIHLLYHACQRLILQTISSQIYQCLHGIV